MNFIFRRKTHDLLDFGVFDFIKLQKCRFILVDCGYLILVLKPSALFHLNMSAKKMKLELKVVYI